MSWRETLAPRISKIIAEVGRDDIKKLRKALSEEGAKLRGNWPYKVWCSEVNNQLGITEARKQEEKAAEFAKVDEAYDGKKLF